MRDGESFVARARSCRSREDIQALYAQWAGTYENDLQTGTHNYVALFIVVEVTLNLGYHTKSPVLDAGCRNGLVGVALAQAGPGSTAIVDGLDLSPHMLRIAEKCGAYRSVLLGDLTKG